MVANSYPKELCPRRAARIPGLRFMGRGTGRAVFTIADDAGAVLKVARNAMGRAQNEVEARTFDPEFTTTVLDHAENYDWILSERVIPMCRLAFSEHGIRKPDDLYAGICSMAHRSGNSQLPPAFARFDAFFTRNPAIMPHDAGSFSSWGLRDGIPVLLDHGFTFPMNWAREKFNSGLGGDPLKFPCLAA